MAGTLTLVGTPIGNLSDVSPRAVAAFESCDFIAAEDTRVSLTLLNHFGIRKPLVSYFEHNKRERGEQICRRLLDGENAVLVTDAGMPAISDPGEELVAQCHEKGIPVTVVPGPSAVVTALAVAGLPTGRFTFEGFLSMNRRHRREHLNSLLTEQRTMVFYEAPHKLPSTLEDMRDAFGADRRICLVRELTKLHEEIRHFTLGEAAGYYRETPPRGEFVLVIEGCEPPAAPPVTVEDAVLFARDVMAEEGLSASMAAKRVAAETGLKKGDIYRALTEEE
jgi:16S rRNA (cytidine1402-2'-O)-methyltransferase